MKNELIEFLFLFRALRMTTTVFPPIMKIEIRASDRETLFKGIAVGSIAGTNAALKFMTQNYDAVNSLYEYVQMHFIFSHSDE